MKPFKQAHRPIYLRITHKVDDAKEQVILSDCEVSISTGVVAGTEWETLSGVYSIELYLPFTREAHGKVWIETNDEPEPVEFNLYTPPSTDDYIIAEGYCCYLPGLRGDRQAVLERLRGETKAPETAGS